MSAEVTVQTPVSDRPVADDKALLPWANKEIIPLVRELRDFANQVTSSTSTVTTPGNGVFTTIWTATMPSGTVWHVHARVAGISTSGANQQAAYTAEAAFVTQGFTAGQVGATNVISTFETAAACNVRMRFSGGAPQLQVQDDGVSSFKWIAQVSVLATVET